MAYINNCSITNGHHLIEKNTELSRKKDTHTHAHTLSIQLYTVCTHLFCCNTGVMMHRTGSLPVKLPSLSSALSIPNWARFLFVSKIHRQMPIESCGRPPHRRKKTSQSQSSDVIATREELKRTQCMHVQCGKQCLGVVTAGCAAHGQ